jgi:UDP-glucose:(heptosyl)LPS alpha-1,3-glucosyltransferase
MKVALVVMHTDPARGGRERYTVDLAASLVSRGHEVALLASSHDDVPAGVKSVRLNARGLGQLFRYNRFLDSLDAHLDRTRYDVVHAMLPVPHCDIYQTHAGLVEANVANDSLATRIFTPRRARTAAVEREMIEAPSPPLVLCISEYVKGIVRQWYPLDDAHLPILFNAVDTRKYDPAARPEARDAARARYGLSADDTVALFVGQDYERKGLREAIEALGRLKAAPGSLTARMKLLVIGRPSGAKYVALAQQLGVADALIMGGHTDDAYGAYAAGDFLVLPTKHDPCSLVVLEALAMGVPVISTRFNGACEIMTPGRHGFVIDDPADTVALASAMQSLSNREQRFPMATACLELRPRLSWERHIDGMLAIYERVRSPSA